MTPEHLKNLLKAYLDVFKQQNELPEQKPDDFRWPLTTGSRVALRHALWMCAESINFVNSGDVDKANRWLGFIQGVLWCGAYYSIEELREHSRPAERGGRLPTISD